MIEEILKNNKGNFANVLPSELFKATVFKLDLSKNNIELLKLDLSTTTKLSEYINKKIEDSNSHIAIGGYGEDRLIYRKSNHFGNGSEIRTIHLGVDIWCESKINVYAPMNSTIHSFKNNDKFGDYGPTIILEHNLEDSVFYTLYGHLSLESLRNIQPGDRIEKGEAFARIGNKEENGNWPTHLHFQIISDLLGGKGDFPGVTDAREQLKYFRLCPDPNLILSIL